MEIRVEEKILRVSKKTSHRAASISLQSLTINFPPNDQIRTTIPNDWGGGQRQAVNVTDGYCAATITTRYEAIGPTNILSLAHYPMTVIMYAFE